MMNGASGLDDKVASTQQLMDQIQQSAAQTADFQMFAAEMNTKHAQFQMLMTAKIEGVKQVGELSKQSIQKANFN